MINLFKKVISGFASVAIVLSVSVVNVQAGTANYSDVPSNAWFADYVNILAEVGIFDSSKSSFNPSANMNRAEFVKTLVEAAGISTKNTSSAGFSDVSSSDWFAPYVNAAVAKGFIDGPKAEKGNKFFPGDSISRAAATKIALGAFSVKTAEYQEPSAPFNDISAHWGKEFITAAYNLSIVDGMGGSKDTFAPNANISRAAVAKVAAYTIVAADKPETFKRLPVDETTGESSSAFEYLDADELKSQVKNLVKSDSEETTEEDEEDMTDEDEEATEEEEEEANEIVRSDGSLEISLSSDSPRGAVVPGAAAGVEVAKYDLTANGDDILLSGMRVTRTGLGDKDDLDNIVIYSGNERVSKVKGFNSDDEANIIFEDGGLSVEAGETVTITVVAEMGGIAYKGNRSAVQIASASMVTSNATEVVGDFPLTANSFEIGSVAAGTLTVETDGNISDVKLGEEEATVMKFKMSNGNVEDVLVKAVTVKEVGTADEEEDVSNFKLVVDNEVVATASRISGKYLTFVLDEPVLIEEGNNEKFQVKADIDGGASTYIYFAFDKKVDIWSTGKKYGYGAGINFSETATTGADDAITVAYAVSDDADAENSVKVEAGEVSIVSVDAEYDTISKDKQNVVLGKVKVTVNSGKDLELEQLKFTLDLDNDAQFLTGALADETLELYDETNGRVFDLEGSISGAGDISLTNTDLGLILRDGTTTTLAIRADTSDAPDFTNGIKFKVTSDVGSWKIKETQDDKYVSDVNPSSISFKSIESKASSATVTLLPLSAGKNAVIGSDDIVALDFEVEAGESSALTVDEIKTTVTISTGNVLNPDPSSNEDAYVSEVKLWKKEGTNETLIDTVAGTQISSNQATFDGFEIAVPSNEKARFIVTATLVDNENLADATIQMSVATADISAEDEDGDDVTVGGTAGASDRTITVKGVGSLTVANWTKDGLNTNKNVLGNTTSDFVAGYEMIATNEPIKIKDLYVDAFYKQSIVFADDEGNGSGSVALNINGTTYTLTASGATTATTATTCDFDATAQNETANVTEVVTALNNCLGSTIASASGAELLVSGLNSVDETNGVDVTVTEVLANFKDSVESISIYADDKTTLLATESVTADSTLFEDLNKVIDEGSENLYIKLKTRKIGKDQAGKLLDSINLAVRVVDAEGDSSDKVAKYNSAVISTSNPVKITHANSVTIVPTLISSVAKETLSTTSLLDNAEATAARLKVTAASNTNTKLADGSSLTTTVRNVTLTAKQVTNITQGTGSTGLCQTGNFVLERIDPITSTKKRVYANSIDCSQAGTSTGFNVGDTVTFDLVNSDFGDNEEVTGTVEYQVKVTADVTTPTSDAYLQLKLDTTTGRITFGSDDASGAINSLNSNAGAYYITNDSIGFGLLEYKGN